MENTFTNGIEKNEKEEIGSAKQKLEARFLHGLGRTIDEYKRTVSSLSGLRDPVVGSSFELMADQMAAGAAVEILSDLFADLAENKRNSPRVLRNAIEKFMQGSVSSGGIVSTKGVGLAMTQTALRTGIETRVISSSSSLLKLSLRALSRGGNILSAISLLGIAFDLLSTFVYNPYKKYERYLSDRLLRALAQAELVATQRLIGNQRLLLEPSEWMVNTRYLDRVADSTYDMLLGIIYTRARRINSDGSLIYWYKDGGGLRRDQNGQLTYFEINNMTRFSHQDSYEGKGTNDFMEMEENYLSISKRTDEKRYGFVSLCSVLLLVIFFIIGSLASLSPSIWFLMIFPTFFSIVIFLISI